MLGDALGGPLEFQSRERCALLGERAPRVWTDDEIFDERAQRAAVARLRLLPYGPLRPEPEPYAHWRESAPPGTLTDDSRHKLVLAGALRAAESRTPWRLEASDLARAYLAWGEKLPRLRPGFSELSRKWLLEWDYAARWVLGERDLAIARPPERLWIGLPTCCGQMTNPPLAAVFPGRPEAAYRVAHEISFYDNGWGRDLNAAWVAGLAAGLALPAERPAGSLAGFVSAMQSTDPYDYASVPWTRRSVDRWVDLAHELVSRSERRPARLFAALDETFRETIKWEAQVPFVVALACLEMADHEPLAALQLSVEWGEDTDSYAALVGGALGALFGSGLFPERLVTPVETRLAIDHGERIEVLVQLLERSARRAN